jgi:hypothetical protein
MSRLTLLLALLFVPTVGTAAEVEVPTGTPISSEPPAEATAPAGWGFENPHRTGYLLGPSAMMHRAGEGSLSQSELLFTSVSQGLTDFASVSVGAMLPALLLGEDSRHAVLGAKLGGSLTERLHLAAGSTVFLLPDETRLFSYGALTYGTSDRHVTLTLSLPMDISEGSQPELHPVPMVGGYLRIASGLALVGEVGWRSQRSTLMAAGGVRFLGKRWDLDVGLLRLPRMRLPSDDLAVIPWASFTFHWSMSNG